MSAHLWGQAALELLEPTVLWKWLPGDAIGPVGAAGMQPTSVVADGACRTLVPMPHARRMLETNHQRLALKLYRYLLGAQFGQEPDDEPPPGPAGDRDPRLRPCERVESRAPRFGGRSRGPDLARHP